MASFRIIKGGNSLFKDRSSKFYGYVFIVDSLADIEKALNQVGEEHPKARHICYAYRLGLSGDEFRMNDDGEPSGTAGKPIMGQIDKEELINTLVVVVRYFGGTKLGVSGLINAYKSAAAMALEESTIGEYIPMQEIQLKTDYKLSDELFRRIDEADGKVLNKEFGKAVEVICSIPVSKAEEFISTLDRNIELIAIDNTDE